ncbi:MAG: DNA polymerase/3'-5' exonuclease PolX [Elusimicrobia bacterium]|nr:DNA polymerase/3'-5' exonuclease PolX [Candidatus Obscuribacterium magneticum]
MHNIALAQILTEIADMQELKKDNIFRIRAFRRASDIIRAQTDDVTTLSRDRLMSLPGIGQGIADIVEEFRDKGRVTEHETLKKKFPQGLLDIMSLSNMGPKRASLLFEKLKVDSIDKLKKVAEAGELLKVPGFGEKLQESLLKSIEYKSETQNRPLISEALAFARELTAYLKKSPDIQELELAGSARRWKETVGDLDFLCTSKNPEKAIHHFSQYPGLKRILAQGSTKASIVLETGLQCDFRVVEAASFGAALLYFTGSKQHNVQLRELALKKGFSLNEYGLFKLSDKKKLKPVAGRTEEDVYKYLGLSWIPPELREDRGEIDAAHEKRLPRLVTEGDVLGDFHNHTNLTDGHNTMEEMAAAAKARGWKWYFCGDHSPSLKVTGGLPAGALLKKKAAVKGLARGEQGIDVYLGSEVDILPDGRLDYEDEILKEIDCVVAAVHGSFKQTEEVMTARLCRAMENPHVHILAHPSGRLIGKRKGYDINYEILLQKAKETGTAIEINGQPDRQDLFDIHVKRAIELGVPLALNTDAHSISDLDNMTYAVHVARRGGAEPKHILNCLPTKELLKWLNG